MKLLYISNARIPSKKVYAIQVVKMCEAFSKIGIEIELLLPKINNDFEEDIAKYYNTDTEFKITKIPIINLSKFGSIGFRIQAVIFTFLAAVYALIKRYDFILFRDVLPLSFLRFFGKKTFWEIHNDLHNMVALSLIKKSTAIISISNGLKSFCLANGRKKEDEILTLHNSVDFKMFNDLPSSEVCRKKLGLPSNKKMVLYSGHLYAWKGVKTLVEAASLLDDDALVVFVGRVDASMQEFFDKKHAKVLLLGQKRYNEIPYYLRAADVLALPNSAKTNVSKFYTSPAKLSEYMASGTPIVASDLPSITEVLNTDNSFLFKADDAEDLAKGINKILKDDSFAKKIAFQAIEYAKEHTSQKRAEKIISFMKRFE